MCTHKNMAERHASSSSESEEESPEVEDFSCPSDEEIDPPSDEALQEVKSHIDEAYRILKRESQRVQHEREAFDSVAKKLEHVQFPSTVRLNVGGQFFTTSIQTLTKDPGSMLHAMFSERIDAKPAEDRSYFIDRDGTQFRYILNYLRSWKLVMSDPSVRGELEVEAEFYQIKGLVKELQSQSPPFSGAASRTRPSNSRRIKQKEPSDQALQKANSYITEAYEILKQEALNVQKEKDAFEVLTSKIEHVHFASTIKLNVGGQFFTTSLQTLTKDPGSMLHAMFSGRFDTKLAEDGCYFIDRDGTHFRYILNYLRTGKLVLSDPSVRDELEVEAEFYQIQGLLKELRRTPKVFNKSVILRDGHHELLTSWLGPQEGRWNLLYRASSDGWLATNFHSRCDNKGSTVTIISSGNNIFGGFTDQAWTGPSNGTYGRAPKSFLFSLINPAGLQPMKISLKPGKSESAVFCFSSYGPTFGTGDLRVMNAPNANNCSTTLNNSYQCPSGQNAATFLAGSQKFTIQEMEVFGFEK